MKIGLIIKRNSKQLICWCGLFIILAIISYPALFYPPHSDYWAEMFYVFHNLDNYPGAIKWLHVLNTDPFEQMRYQPLSHLFYYIEQLLFGSNFTFFNIINFLFYFLSIFILYKFALYFFKNKKLILFLIGFFSVLFNHFDIILWSCHMYIIIGFCMFLLGFILYFKFLKTGRLLFASYVIACFLLSMWCYESFFFWPFAIIIISSIRSFKSKNLPKKNLIVANIIILIAVYLIYILVYFFTRSLGTYDAPAHLISDFLRLNRFIYSGCLVLLNFFYNGLIVNIYPLLSFPLLVAVNISLGGVVIDFFRNNPIAIIYGGGFCFCVLLLYFRALFVRKYIEELKIIIFLLFLLFSSFYIIVFCRLVTNNIVFGLTEFRYQYISNALILVLIGYIIDRFFVLSNKRVKLIAVGLIIPLILNIYCIRKMIEIYNYHYADLKRMITNVKNGIHSGDINENAKLYIDSNIPDYLPTLCWNIEMGERFMEGTYQWMFSRKEIKYFAKSFQDASWIINKEDFSVISKILKPTFEKAKKINSIKSDVYINVGKDRMYYDLGCMYETQGDYKRAGDLYKKALILNPECTEAQYGLDKVLSIKRRDSK